MEIDLKKIRQENGSLTQSEMADKLGINLRTVQKYEQGFPIPKSMEKLIIYEFNLAEQKEHVPRDIVEETHAMISMLEEKLNTKDGRVVSSIKENFLKINTEKEAYKDKYYKTLERLDKLKTYMIKTLKIPEKFLD